MVRVGSGRRVLRVKDRQGLDNFVGWAGIHRSAQGRKVGFEHEDRLLEVDDARCQVAHGLLLRRCGGGPLLVGCIKEEATDILKELSVGCQRVDCVNPCVIGFLARDERV